MAHFHPTESNTFFFTATILNWKHLLKDDDKKIIIADSLAFLANNYRVIIYAFVIMPNHLHLIWHIYDGHQLKNVQRDFLKFTGQQLKFSIQNNNFWMNEFLVNAKDRKYQIWERNSFSFVLWKNDTLLQKINYIHENQVREKWRLAETPEQYRFSSAAFYATGKSEFNFLTHFRDNF